MRVRIAGSGSGAQWHSERSRTAASRGEERCRGPGLINGYRRGRQCRRRRRRVTGWKWWRSRRSGVGRSAQRANLLAETGRCSALLVMTITTAAHEDYGRHAELHGPELMVETAAHNLDERRARRTQLWAIPDGGWRLDPNVSRGGGAERRRMSALHGSMALYYAARHGQGKAPERPSRLSHGGAACRHRSDSQRTGTRAKRQPSCAARDRPALYGAAR